MGFVGVSDKLALTMTSARRNSPGAKPRFAKSGGAGEGDVWEGDGDVKAMTEANGVMACLRVTRCTIAVACVMAGAAACSSSARPPTATVSRSASGERDLQPLLARWARASRAERTAMGPALATFRQLHADDEVAARLAEALLAWVALEKGALRAAEVQAHRTRDAAGPGSVADVCRAVEGAALRRQGRAKEALDLLLPLVSKLIDPWARALLNREAVQSAVDAQRWTVALGLMRVWLREATQDERAGARAAIEQGLAQAPTPELLALLEEPQTADEDLEIRKLTAQRLAFVARAGKDVQLAQRLLSRAGALLGDQADVVAQLAAGASRARVEARTVGLLLSLRDDATRRRGTEIAQGVAFGLGLPGSTARLVTRDDHGAKERIEEALAALSADGASVLIAGNDEVEADIAATFADAHKIPVLLLRAPSIDRGPFTFVVGVDGGTMLAALVASLSAHGVARAALVGDELAVADAPRPPTDPLIARSCAEPVGTWRTLGVGGIVLPAPVACTKETLGAAAALHLRLAVGLDHDALALPAGTLLATAGAFPFAEPSTSLRGWTPGHGAPPSWWAALGRDAAVLAWAGVQGLPLQGTEEPSEVDARRAQAGASLAAARVELWTSEAAGFGGARVLPRTLVVREIGAAVRHRGG
jgi:hypothetical protein